MIVLSYAGRNAKKSTNFEICRDRVAKKLYLIEDHQSTVAFERAFSQLYVCLFVGFLSLFFGGGQSLVQILYLQIHRYFETGKVCYTAVKCRRFRKQITFDNHGVYVCLLFHTVPLL